MSFGFDYASVDGNKPPHWPDVLRAGFTFGWLRASFTYWDPAHHAWIASGDPTFHRDWANLPKELTRGAYMFPVLQASQSPEEQVGVFKASVDRAGGLRRGVDFPPCLDVEFPGGIAKTGLDRAGVLAWIRRAVVALKQSFGVAPIIYTSGRVWNDTDSDCLGNPIAPDLVDCPLWLARYPYKTRITAVIPPPTTLTAPPVPTPWVGPSGFVAHQYQGDAVSVPGFTSTVDLDRWHTIAPGDHDPLVRWYKRKIATLQSPDLGPLDSASDKYDRDLASAIRVIQAKYGLIVDGYAGVKTFCSIAWL